MRFNGQVAQKPHRSFRGFLFILHFKPMRFYWHFAQKPHRFLIIIHKTSLFIMIPSHPWWEGFIATMI